MLGIRLKRLGELAAAGKLRGSRVLIRADYNVPLDPSGRIRSDARLRASLPTLSQLLEAGAELLLMSHLGRPDPDDRGTAADDRYSLRPVARRLSELLGEQVVLMADWPARQQPLPARLVLLENVRLLQGETAGDVQLARKMAALGDVYVMDAFATAHRAHASTSVVAAFAPQACAGPLLLAELDALSRARVDPPAPVVALIGGAKVSTKLPLLRSLAARVDHLLLGGGLANTFLAAAGFNVGQSMHEPGLLAEARSLAAAVHIPMPEDLVVATAGEVNPVPRRVAATAVADDDRIMDLGPLSTRAWAQLLRSAGTVIWNGPVGVFEDPRFAAGTRTLAEAVADCPGYTLAGGGDTVAAAEQFGVSKRLSYVSTGGGAFLEYMQGLELPAVAALEAAQTDVK